MTGDGTCSQTGVILRPSVGSGPVPIGTMRASEQRDARNEAWKCWPSETQGNTSMLSGDVTIADLERLGTVLEPLVNSTRLNEDEKWAVETAVRAANDLADIRHSEFARAFYARDDIQQRSAESIQSWLAANPDATPGTVTAVCGRMHVASVGADGKLQLLPFLDL